MGYRRPLAVGEALRDQPAPYLGLAAVLIRALLDAFLLYLPLSLMGRQPAAAAYRSLLGIPVRLGIVLNVLYLAIYVPLAMILVRAPV